MPEKKSQKSKVKSKKTETLPQSNSKLNTKVHKGIPKSKIEKVLKEKVIKTKVKIVRKPKPDLKSSIIDGILDKKGEEIVVIDFNKINNSLCDYFIVCQGSSDRQVSSIADGIEERVRKQMGRKPLHKEGFENAQWILLDYIDIVVHIFQPDTRNFYQIEALWADANQLTINS
jgi:ribosome-associated protein